MQAIKCELCGNNELIKRDGVFECTYCNTKYTLEEARKLFVSGTVSIEGDVQTKDADFIIKAGVLEKYNGESADVVIPDTVKAIGDNCFRELSVESVTIPDSVKSIGKSSFYACLSLKSITIPDSVTQIGIEAFRCSSLESVIISNSLTKIKNDTFRGCSYLKSVTIPDSVTAIQDGAFAYCKSLISVKIPNDITSVGNGVFEGCTSLRPYNVETPIFDGKIFPDFPQKGYCGRCAGKIKWGLFSGKCLRCGALYDK